MFPVVATGALNPEPGLTAAATTVATSTLSTQADAPATGVAPNYGADKLAAQIADTLARCRRLGHREPAVTLTRPTGVVAGVELLLRASGFAVQVQPARIGGCSTLTVRG